MSGMPPDPWREDDGTILDVLREGELAVVQVAALIGNPKASWPVAVRAAEALGDDHRHSAVLFAGFAMMMDERERESERQRRRVQRRNGRPRWWRGSR